MAVFSVRIKVKSVQMTQQLPMEVVVDTGASLGIIPKEALDKIGVKPLWRRQFTLANGEKIERDVGIAIFNWNGYEGASEVIFGESEDKPLLGALTLESLGLKVNPREQKIEPGEMWLLKLTTIEKLKGDTSECANELD